MAVEIAKEIRKELKAKGYTARQVSVRAPHYGSINVTIKAAGIKKSEIEEVAMKHKKVHYCEMTHEILSGGNLFVNVDYSWELKEEATKAGAAVANSLDLGKTDVFGGLATVYVDGPDAYHPFAVWVGDDHFGTAYDVHELARLLGRLLLDSGADLQNNAA